MNPHKLMVVNGLLVASMAVGLGIYLFSGHDESALERQTPASSAKGQTQGSSNRATESWEPHEASERVLTDEQGARQETMAAAHSAGSESFERPVVAAATPMAFLEVDPSTKLTPAQEQLIQLLRQEFSDSMQAAGEPSSPEYVKKWAAEQRRLDQLLTAYLGVGIVNQLHQANP